MLNSLPDLRILNVGVLLVLTGRTSSHLLNQVRPHMLRSPRYCSSSSEPRGSSTRQNDIRNYQTWLYQSWRRLSPICTGVPGSLIEDCDCVRSTRHDFRRQLTSKARRRHPHHAPKQSIELRQRLETNTVSNFTNVEVWI